MKSWMPALRALGRRAHFVNGRRQETGVRMALGATPAQILASFAGGAGRIILAGIVLGAAITFAGQCVVKSMLFGVGPFDAVSLAAAATLLATRPNQ